MSFCGIVYTTSFVHLFYIEPRREVMVSDCYKPLLLVSDLMLFPVSIQIQARQKLVPWIVPPKSQNVICMIQIFSKSKLGMGDSSKLYSAVLEGGTIMTGCHKFSYQLSSSWFSTCPGCIILILFLGFSQRTLVCVLLLSQCLWAKEDLGISIPPSC